MKDNFPGLSSNDVLATPISGKETSMTQPLRVDGVDISHHQQQNIGWDALKRAGVQWMYHKATEGTSFRDPNYDVRRREAKRADMPFGAYHFARPSGGDARAEARFFINVAKPVEGDLRPCLDLETKEHLQGAALVRWADEFCDEVEKLTGFVPVVYTPYVLSAELEKKAIFWVPRYNDDNRPPARQWDIWQFSDGQFGVPDSVPGLGHVDLNHSKVSVDRLVMRKKEPESSKLRMQHTSLQFSDPKRQQRQDIHDLFDQGKAYPIKTGTEAGADKSGDNMNRAFLRQFADEYNHAIHFAADNWIAVDRAIIKRGSLVRDELFLVSNDNMVGHGHDRVMCTMEFDHVDAGIGHLAIGSVHYPVKARTPSDPNWDIAKACADKINRWMIEMGAGENLAFLNGDFNMADTLERQDWAFGGKFTSMADELKAWENTGHGPIDGFCSFDRDGRVTAQRFNVLNDKEMFQHSDHFVCRGVWDVRHLKNA